MGPVEENVCKLTCLPERLLKWTSFSDFSFTNWFHLPCPRNELHLAFDWLSCHYRFLLLLTSLFLSSSLTTALLWQVRNQTFNQLLLRSYQLFTPEEHTLSLSCPVNILSRHRGSSLMVSERIPGFCKHFSACKVTCTRQSLIYDIKESSSSLVDPALTQFCTFFLSHTILPTSSITGLTSIFSD